VGDRLFWNVLSFFLDDCLLCTGFEGEAFRFGFVEGVGRLSAECFAPTMLGGVALWGCVVGLCCGVAFIGCITCLVSTIADCL
jgi:hypothetical protein